jgi:hypothetical protein
MVGGGLALVTGGVLTGVVPRTSGDLVVEGMVDLWIGSVLGGTFGSVGFVIRSPPVEDCAEDGVDAVGGTKLSGPDFESVEPWHIYKEDILRRTWLLLFEQPFIYNYTIIYHYKNNIILLNRKEQKQTILLKFIQG